MIKGGTVVNAHHQEIADVYVEDGIIAAVKPNIKVYNSLLYSLVFDVVGGTYHNASDENVVACELGIY